MRRIYDSTALDRDDENPYQPNESDARATPRAARTVPAAALSTALVPQWAVRRALSVDVSSPDRVYEVGSAIPFRVELRNALPIPVTVTTRSPILWTWDVDGHREASRVPGGLPDGTGSFTFDRGERKLFDRSWHGSFQVSASEWERATPGEYTIGAGLAVDAAADRGVYDQTTVRLE
ncbi:hypothetical protein [Halorubrum sp. DTA98]|uniref:hypothetical protein n=1 Tax=Halorubrum sp. DTA98 TaxID=3402163 RepID=UPI003AAD3A04